MKKRYAMSKNIKTKEVDSLFDAVLNLKSREECYLFFGDLPINNLQRNTIFSNCENNLFEK